MRISIVRFLFWVLGSGFWVLQFGCSSTPSWPANTNVQIARENNPGNIVSSIDVAIQQGRVPLARVRNAETIFGTLAPGHYVLTAMSQDPFAHTQFSREVWASAPLTLKVEPGKRYYLRVDQPPTGVGWQLRLIKTE